MARSMSRPRETDTDVLTGAVIDYLALRAALGYSQDTDLASQLSAFAEWAKATGHTGPLTVDLAVRWARLDEPQNAVRCARRLHQVRRLAIHCSGVDSRHEVPPYGFLGKEKRRQTPYIYTDAELAALLRAAASVRSPRGLRARTYTTLFGLLASAGLRVREALRLTRDDVDLASGCLTIRHTKFKKSRLVPVHTSVTAKLRQYAQRRDSLAVPGPTFFVQENGRAFPYQTVLYVFHCCLKRAGLARAGPRRQPRIHDLRHTFTCRRLTGWYREGADVNVKIAALSTYLGHVSVVATYWYITGVPELMALAAARLERRRL